MCVRGGEETDRLSRGWLLLLHQATDCTGRGEPMQTWSQFNEHTRPTLRRLQAYYPVLPTDGPITGLGWPEAMQVNILPKDVTQQFS